MEKKEILQIIKQERKAEVKDLQDIMKLIEQYPYCELFPILYINEQKKLGQDIIPSLKKYSIYINNRAKYIENLLYIPEMKNKDFEQVSKNNLQQPENKDNTNKVTKQQDKKYDSKFDEKIYRRQSEHHKSVLQDIIRDKVDSFIAFSKGLVKAGISEDDFNKLVEENALKNKQNFENQKNEIEVISNSKKQDENINKTQLKENKSTIETNKIENKEIIQKQTESTKIEEKETKKNLQSDELNEKTRGLLDKIEQLKTKKLLNEDKKENEQKHQPDNKNVEQNQKTLENNKEIKKEKEINEKIENKEKEIDENKNQNISQKKQTAADILIEKIKNRKKNQQQNKEEQEFIDLELINKIEISQTENKDNFTKENTENTPTEIIEIDFDKISKQIDENHQQEKEKNEQLKVEKQQTNSVEFADKKIEETKKIPQEKNLLQNVSITQNIKDNKLEKKNIEIEKTDKEEKKEIKSAADKVLEKLAQRKKEPQNIIDEFIQNQPTIDRKKEPSTQEDLSEKSVKEMEIVTERLAEIYVLQGLKDKAIEVYEKLILKYPEKNIYFAKKIEELKK